jgi:antitoxin FitA
MPDVVVEEVNEEILNLLQGRAEANGRSLQAELKAILEQAAQARMLEARARAAQIRASFGQGTFSDSAILLAEDRQR